MRGFIVLVVVIALAGCSYQPRAGYNSVIVERIATDEVMVSPGFDDKFIVATGGSVFDETLMNIRKHKGYEVVQECRAGAVRLQGKLVNVYSTTESSSHGIINRRSKEDNEYTFVVRGILLDCRTGKTIDSITIDDSEEEPFKAVSHIGQKLARFVVYEVNK